MQDGQIFHVNVYGLSPIKGSVWFMSSVKLN